jgi:protein-S-isoprenylcysteine O-methyltransferase Ste14
MPLATMRETVVNFSLSQLSMNLLKHPTGVIFFVGFIVYLSIRGYYARRAKQVPKVHWQIDGLETFLLLLVIPSSGLLPLVYLFTPWLSFADYRVPTFVHWLGVALMAPGLWLFWRSHADLGRNWSVSLEVCKEHQLITDGVYRFIRHPMYAAIILLSVAQALVLPNWLAGWSALATFSVMYLLRTPREELMMSQVFGQEYRDYMNKTGRLIPRF